MTRTILIVDDEPFNVDLLEQELEDLGYTTASAINGKEALDRLDTTDFDAVLLDVMMPELDGVGVLEALRKDGRLSRLPVIVVSSLNDMGCVQKCLELGAEDYLFKPIDAGLLQARLAGALEKKALRDQVAAQLEVTKSIFGKYVSTAVAEAIMSDQGRLAPVECEATVMFCDIKGFTALAETLSPSKVLDLLSAFYSAVLVPVERHNGTVNEFMGDGMLVTFNAPVTISNHADAAVKTALEIYEILQTQTFEGITLSVRVGIATGRIVSGNIRTRERLNYTVLGDTVNLAARLETANKETNSWLLISQSTAMQLPNTAEFEALEITVSGKSDPVIAYKFIGLASFSDCEDGC